MKMKIFLKIFILVAGLAVSVIAASDSVTIYSYDASGNIVGIASTTTVIGQPIVSQLTPSTIPLSGSTQITATGSNFAGVTITIAGPGLFTIANVILVSNDEIRFDVVTNNESTGEFTLTFTNSFGSATATISVGTGFPTGPPA